MPYQSNEAGISVLLFTAAILIPSEHRRRRTGTPILIVVRENISLVCILYLSTRTKVIVLTLIKSPFMYPKEV